jgi:2-methylcitrate dehydratase PrpD
LRASAGVFQPRVLRVTTRTGDRLEARVEVNRGGPGNPLSDEELGTKFHLNATRTLPEATSLTPLTTLLPPRRRPLTRPGGS